MTCARVVKSLTELEIVVLNSHSHYDHIGGNYAFPVIFALENDYTRERAKGLSHEQVAEYASPAWIRGEPPPGFDPGSYEIRPFSFRRWVEAGEFLDLGGVSLEIIATPGHAPDSISLMDHANRILFTGDTFYLAPLYTHIPGSSFAQYRASAARLAELTQDLDVLMTSHNVPVADPSYLQAMHRGFEAIASGEADFTTTDGARKYRFDGFSILTGDPP